MKIITVTALLAKYIYAFI